MIFLPGFFIFFLKSFNMRVVLSDFFAPRRNYRICRIISLSTFDKESQYREEGKKRKAGHKMSGLLRDWKLG